MIPPHEETFAVHSYEVDAFGTLEVPALAGFLQELAGHHAEALGVGLPALRARGVTWVLGRQRIEVDVPVAQGDELAISTWPSGIERLAATREFEARRGGELVARASTSWLVLDLETRRPVRPEKVLDPRFPRERTAQVAPFAAGKLPELARWEAEKRFHVRYADIDVNRHVTNTSYVAWALEAAPGDLWATARVRSVEAAFLAECTYGSAVLSRLAGTGERAFAHAVVAEEDGRELARVTTRWTAR